MTKLEEILDKHTNVLKDDATHVLTVRVLSNAMREYAEWYAEHLRTKMRKEKQKLPTDGYWLIIDQCKLPEHD